MCVALGVQDNFPNGDNKVYRIVSYCIVLYRMSYSTLASDS